MNENTSKEIKINFNTLIVELSTFDFALNATDCSQLLFPKEGINIFDLRQFDLILDYYAKSRSSQVAWIESDDRKFLVHVQMQGLPNFLSIAFSVNCLLHTIVKSDHLLPGEMLKMLISVSLFGNFAL